MNKINILGMLGIFVIGIVVGALGMIVFMDGEPKKATVPHPIEEKEQVPPVDEAAVLPVLEDTEENTDTEQNENVTPPPPRPMGVNTSYFEGPFGVDSQKLLNKGILPSTYMIAIVSKLDFERNNGGTWYANNFQVSNYLDLAVLFASPYPQQNDLKEGDFIGIKAIPRSYKINDFVSSPIKIDIHMKVRNDGTYFSKAKILENISSQSVNCNIDNISELSVPGVGRNVTGVIMAVEIKPNRNPEPDNPSDYVIRQAVMKCADGNLYIANFSTSTHHPPSHAFGEGDVVTVGYSYTDNRNRLEFAAYYKKEE